MVNITSHNIPFKGMFIGKEKMEGRRFDLKFHWVPLEDLKDIEVYPTNVVELMDKIDQGAQHFIYQE